MTNKVNLDSILHEGLRPDSEGIIYFSPKLNLYLEACGALDRPSPPFPEKINLEVNIEAYYYKIICDWEIQCFTTTNIPPSLIKLYEKN